MHVVVQSDNPAKHVLRGEPTEVTEAPSVLSCGAVQVVRGVSFRAGWQPHEDPAEGPGNIYVGGVKIVFMASRSEGGQTGGGAGDVEMRDIMEAVDEPPHVYGGSCASCMDDRTQSVKELAASVNRLTNEFERVFRTLPRPQPAFVD